MKLALRRPSRLQTARAVFLPRTRSALRRARRERRRSVEHSTADGKRPEMRTFANPSHDPFFNQAFEEYVFNTFREGDVFLLWRNAPAVIVGRYQNICREVHAQALRERGIPVVRRMSGGGTVYHARRNGHLCSDAGGAGPHPAAGSGAVRCLGVHLRRESAVQY